MKVSTILSVFAVKYCVFFYIIIHEVQAQCDSVCEYNPEPIGFADCTSRSFTTIPDECRSCTYLDMTSNEVRYLDKTSLAGFSNVMYIYLENNNIRNITPGAFSACVKVRDIFLMNNPLVVLRDNTFNGLSELGNLYIGNANLQIVETNAFAGLPSLVKLFLNDNALTVLAETVFHNLRTLQYLLLSNNRLESLHREQFQNLIQLKYLGIQNNQITRIGDGVFTGLLSLAKLDMSSNGISEIESGAFDFTVTVNLELIDFTNNNLISTNTMPTQLADVNNVFYAQNPMVCNCDSLVLMEWYQKHNTSLDVKADVVCHGPRELDGAAMRNISDHVTESCTSFPKPTKKNLEEGPVLIPIPTITAKPQFDSRDSIYTPVQNFQATVTKSDEDHDDTQPIVNAVLGHNTDMNNESKIFMYVGIAAVTVCSIVIIIGLVILCKWYGVNNRTHTQVPQDPVPKPTLNITQNPMTEQTDDIPSEDEEEDEVYEMIQGRNDFYNYPKRIRKISERSVDSAYSEGSSPDSIDYAPPTYPPPPPPHQAMSGYIPFYQSKNGQVYLCTRCPHDSFVASGQPVLMHSVSVPAHCSDLANAPTMHRHNSLPESDYHSAMHRQNSLPESDYDSTTQSSHYISCAVQAPTSHQQVPIGQNSAPQTQTSLEVDGTHNHMHQECPPIPLQTDIAHYTKIDMSSYPSTNPFANTTT